MFKVLIDKGNAPKNTGIGVSSMSLLDALQRFGGEDISASELGISNAQSHLRPLRRLGYLWRLRRAASRSYDGAQVVHFNNVYVPEVHPKVAYVATIHDLDVIEHPKLYQRSYIGYYSRSVQGALKRASIIVADTEVVKRAIMVHYGVSGDRIVVTGIGIAPDFARACGVLGDPRDKQIPLVLCVGKLEKKKNHAWLVRKTAEGIKSGAIPKLKLVLAGNSGFGFEEVATAMNDAGPIVEHVCNPDVLKLATLYRRASALVLPSICEGFGIPLVEAMWCGVPIVASRIPSSIEVADGAAEFFTLGKAEEYYEALNNVLKGVNAASRLSSAGRQLQKFSWENLVPKYISVYKKALASK